MKHLFLLTVALTVILTCKLSAQTIDERVQTLKKQLSIEEKIDLLCANAPAIPHLGIPAYNWWSECLHGVARAGKATVFPKPIGMGSLWDTELVKRITTAVSDEARAKYHKMLRENGYTLRYQGLTFFSPTLNIARDPRWGRTSECFSEDPYLTGETGDAFVKGLQGDDPNYLKLVATPKHFVANNEENRRMSGSAKVDEQSLREYFFPAFRSSIEKAGAASVMGAYNALNGVPCCADSFLLTQVLRDEWGFDGIVISDATSIRRISANHRYRPSYEEGAAAALKAGCDMALGDEYRDGLRYAYRMKLVSAADIDRAVERVLKLRFRLGMFDDPEKVPYANIPYSVVECEAHRQLALEAAQKSVILLKNNGLLPLNLRKTKKIALIGDAFQKIDYGDYSGQPEHDFTLLEALKNEWKETELIWVADNEKGDTTPSDGHDLTPEKAARQADVAIIFLRDMGGMEGRDRSTLALKPAQEDLVARVAKANPNTALLIGSGVPLLLGNVSKQVKALLNVWIAGQGEAQAIADILSGKVNPSGKTPVTFFADEKQLPALNDYDVKNGRSYQYFKGDVLYPFGFGLSYTTFAYARPQMLQSQIDRDGTIDVSVKIANKGRFDGEEIVQCYVSSKEWEKEGLKRKLVAFKRISLQKGASGSLAFQIPTTELSRWNVEKHCWEVRTGEYTLSIVSHSGLTNDVRFVVL
ncbi:MAG: glycoside hydrolase family 3 C-terminal domain-containing protein [Prevotellaceae bacterium]|jgi:beta-glucosidase-like glycosyl hydrolase|nr:glycoside hydrolase family 3 C-terminal domain-containing protein [Prevotellaceae bacterium]